MTDRPVLRLFLGDVIQLKRAHPCGGCSWQVDRLGADIGLRCTTCARHVLLERSVLEARFADFIERGNAEITAAVEQGSKVGHPT